MPLRPTALALFLALPLLAVPAGAAPVDAKVGDVRATFRKLGTVLRQEPSAVASPVATLPYGTQVDVLEARKPWLRVRARTGAAAEGWLQAWDTVELSALGASPAPPHLTTSGGGASARDTSAAGRQLDADTERGYRATRSDLERGYRAVDAMEAATQALHPADALGFVDEGNLGRRGRDYARPGRVKPSGRPRPRASGGRGLGGLAGKLGGEAARRLGAGKTGQRLVESAISEGLDYVEQVKVKFTPEQEYFLGRAVAAQAIARYGVDPDANRRAYVRLVGEALVRLDDRMPANFGGYHFEVLDSDEVNGVSGPGGFVLVTRGAVLACRSEAELAGILAHELAHVRNQDGERLVRQGREFPAQIKLLAGVVGGAAGRADIARGFVAFFGKVVDSTAGIAMDQGYGRELEFVADREGTQTLYEVFYEPSGLQTFLANLPEGRGHQGGGASHAPPAARSAALTSVVAALPFEASAEVLAPRATRFARALGR